MNGCTDRFGQRLSANVAALRARQPDLAAQIDAIGDSAPARLVRGRDGHDVILLEHSDDADIWLGGSSMPTVSSPAILGGYTHFRDSVLLCSIGTGYEPPMLAGQLAPPGAVFVHEPDIRLIRLGLGVCDWTGPLERGGIVILTGDPRTALTGFFEAHPGYNAPMHLWPLPHVPPDHLDHLTHQMRAALAQIHDIQRDCIARALDRSSPGGPADPDRPPRLWIGSVDFGPQTAEHADRVARSAAAMGWLVTTCIPDRPHRASDAVRAASAADCDPDLALWINSCPSAWTARLARTRHVAWFLETAALPADALKGIEHCGQILAASQPVRDLLIGRGAGPDATRIVEIGVDAERFGVSTEGNNAAIENRVLILADGCDVSPSAAGVGLESHQRIWNTFVQMLERRPDAFALDDLDAWLTRCEELTGYRLGDVALRRDFAALIARRLPATLLTRSAVLALDRAGLSVRLLGRGWNTFADLSGVMDGPIPPAADRLAAYRSCSVLVTPWLDARSIQFAQEALAAGCLPILRRSGPRLSVAYPQSGALMADWPAFRGLDELVTFCRDLAADPVRHMNTTGRLRNALMKSHTTRHRLTAIVTGGGNRGEGACGSGPAHKRLRSAGVVQYD